MTVLDNSQYLPGVHGEALSEQICCLSGDGGASGRGVTSSAGHKKRARLASHDAAGLGVHSPSGGRPQLGDAYDIGRGVNGHGDLRLCDARRAWLQGWFARLEDRLRLVRVCYGRWNRICDSRTTMTRLGITGAFLDPPYAKSLDRLAAWVAHLRGDGPEPGAAAGKANRAGGLYHGDQSQDVDRLVAEVQLWCERWGADSVVRIALCGYEGEHDALEDQGWTVEAWKAHGGYANRNADNQNKHRERIWFSPGCLQSGDVQRELF